MDDGRKPSEDPLANPRPQSLARKPSTMSVRHRERLDDLARTALDCKDPRQAVVRYAMAKSFGMAAWVAENLEHIRPMAIREFRKNVLPILSTAAALTKQGARCAQIDREYDQAPERNDESYDSPSGTAPGETAL